MGDNTNNISIHALRKESDFSKCQKIANGMNFNPRSP